MRASSTASTWSDGAEVDDLPRLRDAAQMLDQMAADGRLVRPLDLHAEPLGHGP